MWAKLLLVAVAICQATADCVGEDCDAAETEVMKVAMLQTRAGHLAENLEDRKAEILAELGSIEEELAALEENQGRGQETTETGMDKVQMVRFVAEKADLSEAQAGSALEAVLKGIVGALKDGDQVQLKDFGMFEVKTRAARTGRNPKTGEPVQIAASIVPSFVPGKGFMESLGLMQTGRGQEETETGMNKTQLIEYVSEKADLSKAKAKAALEAVLEGIVGALKEGDQVQLIGFGTFAVNNQGVPYFVPGKALKESVN